MKKTLKILIGIAAVLAILALAGYFFLFGFANDHAPDYVTKKLIPKNAYSRPGEKIPEVKSIVIHYVANPGSSAIANRNYFKNLAITHSTKASAHFIVGLEGEVIQCIPMTEIAYANYPRNYDTISIEVCHPDETGKFNDTTYERLTELAADLLKLYGLTAEDVIRHHDVSGKNCPKYFVEHEDEWDAFKEAVKKRLN